MSNAWEQLNRDDPQGKPEGEDDATFHDDSMHGGHHNMDTEDAQISRFDEHVIDAEETVEQDKPKKNLKPLLFALAAVFVAIVGGMIYLVSAMLGAPVQASGYSQAPAPTQTLEPSTAGMSLQSGESAPVNMFADSASGEAAPAAPAAGGLSAGLGQGPGQGSPIDVAAAPADSTMVIGTQSAQIEAAGAAAAASSTANDEQRAALEQRLVSMEGDIAEIKRKLDELAKAPRQSARASQTAPRTQANSAPVRSASRPQPRGEPRTTARPAAATASTTSTPATEASSALSAQPPMQLAAAPAGVDGLSLRAVNPPHGPDMQAWVMDGERIVVVSRGSTIRGARVTSIEIDRVVTDRGVIR